MKLTRYEQETIVNFNAEEPDAIVYTRDKAVMRQLDALVTEYPDIFKCIGETDIDKTYSMPKSRISYRKPRRISEAKRQQARDAMKKNQYFEVLREKTWRQLQAFVVQCKLAIDPSFDGANVLRPNNKCDGIMPRRTLSWTRQYVNFLPESVDFG